jgi:uncharacterized protein YfiM (DUF2279 family)
MCFLLVSIASFAQGTLLENDSDQTSAIEQQQKKKFRTVLWSGAGVYSAISLGLYQSWYKQYPTSSFHFHNDWNNWNQVDKFGHVYATYQATELAFKAFRWSGADETKSARYGVISSLLFQTTVEIMDGYSEGWGFSLADFGMNVFGAAMFLSQQRAWGAQRVKLKFSFFPDGNDLQGFGQDGLIKQRYQQLFGTSWTEGLLKDYNKQTYWISFDSNFLFRQTNMPDWLNFAIGYGGDNMLGASANTWAGPEGVSPLLGNEIQRYRQFYLSLDMDLSKLKVRGPFWRTVLDVLNVLKIPFSAIEINTLGQIKFHLIHF